MGTMKDKCKICGNNENNDIIAVKEMLKGSRNIHDYLECSSCGSLQLVDPPETMSPYYDNSSYESFVPKQPGYLKTLARRTRNRYAILNKGGVIAKILSWHRPLTFDFTVINHYSAATTKILDVGCGFGWYINDLSDIGFTDVSGIDPFIDKDLIYPNGVTVKKLYIEQVKGLYDIVISHHSLEHVPNPLQTLVSIRKRLNAGGICLLTVPVAEELYRQYKQNCYLIQAPQHFFLFSINAVIQLATAAGFQIEIVHRDSINTACWYKYSEIWKRGIANNEIEKSVDSYFSREELHRLKNLELELRGEKKGDNVTFILRNEI